MTSVTEEEAMDSLLSTATLLGLPATSWQSGGVARTILAIMARTLSVGSTVLSVVAKGAYLGLATGDWLTNLAERNFNVIRNPATRAQGPVILFNSTPNAITVAAGELVVSNPLTGKTYTNQADYVSVGMDTVVLTFAADGEGSAWNAQAMQINQVVTSLIGVNCTNTVALIGADQETDAALTLRAAQSFALLSPLGPKDIYRAVLMDRVLTPTLDAVNRVIVYPNYATGRITVVAAGTAGALSVGDVAIAQASVEKWAEPQCIIATVESGSDFVVDVTLTIKTKGESRTQAQMLAIVQTALGEFINDLPIGGLIIAPSFTGRVDLTAMGAAVFGASKTIKDVDFALPTGDIVLMPNNVARLGTVTLTLLNSNV